jgi:outer membrane protein OmpA-like peptidoglycan-associated protein
VNTKIILTGLILFSAIFASCSSARTRFQQLEQNKKWQAFCGCSTPTAAPALVVPSETKPAEATAVLGSLEEGALDKMGTPDYLERVYTSTKDYFEASGTKFEVMATGLKATGVSLEKVLDDEKKIREILVNIDGDLSFPSGKSTLTPAAKQLVGKIADVIHAYPETAVRIGGHTDTPGSLQLNLKLSKARAVAVKTEMQNKHKIAESRFKEVDGFADKFKIINTTKSEARNRRTEIRVGTVRIVLK